MMDSSLQQPITLSFDRGTLLLTGPQPRESLEWGGVVGLEVGCARGGVAVRGDSLPVGPRGAEPAVRGGLSG